VWHYAELISNAGEIEMTDTFLRKIAVMLAAPMLVPLLPGVWAQSAVEVPSDFKPPEGAKLILHALGKGDQIYTCQQQNGQYAWTLKAPEAQLFNEKGEVLGRHFAGPTWEANDKSAVTGKVVAHADSPEKDAIPWLLLAAVEHSGNGLMSNVSNIQRLNTKGGKAPTAGCDESRAGAETRVSYTADYFFYEN
jgi:Protein of unknown function (DUF3455)